MPAKLRSSTGGNKKIKQNKKLVPVLIRLKFDEFRRIFDDMSWSTKRPSHLNVASMKCHSRRSVLSTK